MVVPRGVKIAGAMLFVATALVAAVVLATAPTDEVVFSRFGCIDDAD